MTSNMTEELIDAGVQENASAARIPFASLRNYHQHDTPISQSQQVASSVFLCCLEGLVVPQSDTGLSCSQTNGLRVLLLPQQPARRARALSTSITTKDLFESQLAHEGLESLLIRGHPLNVDFSTASPLCDWLKCHRLLAYIINKHCGPYRCHTLTPGK